MILLSKYFVSKHKKEAAIRKKIEGLNSRNKSKQ
jgi:hypothetical protein